MDCSLSHQVPGTIVQRFLLGGVVWAEKERLNFHPHFESCEISQFHYGYISIPSKYVHISAPCSLFGMCIGCPRRKIWIDRELSLPGILIPFLALWKRADLWLELPSQYKSNTSVRINSWSAIMRSYHRYSCVVFRPRHGRGLRI